MATSARWPAILEALSLLRTTENVEKLNASKTDRDAVIAMLESANKRFRNANAEWVVEKSLPALLDAIIAARNGRDTRIETLLKEFLRVTVFPPSQYRFYKNDEEGIKFDREKADDKEPEAKKAKTDQIHVKLWEREAEFQSPSRALILCEAVSESYGRRVMTHPFLKLLAATGFDLKQIPNPENLSTGHCRLLSFFATYVDRERFHVKGNAKSATGNFVKNSLHALLVNDEIDLIELETLLNHVADLDPMILQQLNPILWKKWAKGEMISALVKMCEYFNKLQSSKKLFGQIFSVDFRDCSSELHLVLRQPFAALSVTWLPSALISDLAFLTRTTLNLLKDPRLAGGDLDSGGAKRVLHVIDIFLIAIGFELDAVDIDHLNLSVQDEEELLQVLDRVSEILSKHGRASKIWLMLTQKFWRLEKQRRLFLSDELDETFLTSEILTKLDELATSSEVGAPALLELTLCRLEWSILNEGKVAKYAKRVSKMVIGQAPVRLTEQAEHILRQIVPVALKHAPKPVTKMVCHFLANGATAFGLELVEDDASLLSSVSEMCCSCPEYSSIVPLLPIVFLSEADLDRVIDTESPNPTEENVPFLLRILSNSSHGKVFSRCEVDENFYEALKKIDPARPTETLKNLVKIVIRHLANSSDRKIDLAKAEIESLLQSLQSAKKSAPHVIVEILLHEWLTLFLALIQPENAAAVTVGFELCDAILGLEGSKFIWAQCDAIKMLLKCYRTSAPTGDFELSEQRRRLVELVYEMLCLKLALVEHGSTEDAIMNNCLGRVFTLLGKQNWEIKAFGLVKTKGISDGTIAACWKIFSPKIIRLRLQLVPQTRQRIELGLALEAVESEVKDKKAQIELLGRIFEAVERCETSSVRFETCLKYVQMKKLHKPNFIIRKILNFLVANPKSESENAEAVRAIHAILNALFVQHSGKMVVLGAAVVGVLKHYLQLAEKLENVEKEAALVFFKRLVTFIKGNNDLKLRLGICLGFLFPILARLLISFPDGGLVEEILFLEFDVMSERQVLAFSAQLGEDQKRRLAQCFDSWKKVKGDTRRFMTV